MPETTSSRASVDSRRLLAPSRIRRQLPSIGECGIALSTSLLLILSFPDFELWPLVWVSLVPLLLLIARRPVAVRSFLLGWLAGSVFFYGSCYWVTFSIIHYGGLSPWIAYLLIVPGAVVLGLFPGLFALVLALAIRRWGLWMFLLGPFFWAAFEWARLALTGQLWNAIAYSQAYQPRLIQAAQWGGVYLVGFLIVLVNAALALAIVSRTKRAAMAAASAIALVAIVVVAARIRQESKPRETPTTFVVAIQPNVPMDLFKPAGEMAELTRRHLTMSEEALRQLPQDSTPRLVIWPESPMNFTYAGNVEFQNLVADFARRNHASVLCNSQEPAPEGGIYNAAILINEEGKLVAQYDKIRLLPFGEYVPLPHWMPGAGLISGIVGDFTPGTNYALMPIGSARAGVFICIESAYPSIARAFAREDADVLINISNDGYLGRTAVMRQHLANAVFRAVENGRPLLRVTNSGISAYITARGEVTETTNGFEVAVRTWTIGRSYTNKTVYTRYSDVFALFCVVITVLVLGSSFMRGKRGEKVDLE